MTARSTAALALALGACGDDACPPDAPDCAAIESDPAPTIEAEVADAYSACQDSVFAHEASIEGDPPPEVLFALVRTDGETSPQDEVHTLAETSPGLWTVVFADGTSQFDCETLGLYTTRLTVIRDGAGQVVDCWASGGDAAGLLDGGYADARQTGAYDALGLSDANCTASAALR